MDRKSSPDALRAENRPAPDPVQAKQLLKVRAVSAIPVIVGSLLIVLIAGFYVGSVVDPIAHLRGLPVSIVNEDAGRVARDTQLRPIPVQGDTTHVRLA